MRMDLQQETDSLSAAAMANTLGGTAGGRAAASYLAGKFQSAGIPAASGQYFQEFNLDEGRAPAPTCRLFVGASSITSDSGFFPLPYSASGSLKANPLVSVQEQGSPWLIPVGDLIDQKQADPRYDLSDSLYGRAAQAAAFGASAVVYYSMHPNDGAVNFDPQDTHPSLSIPVIFIRNKVASKYFRDDSGSIALEIQVSVIPRFAKGYNILGYIDNHAPNTALICAHYDHPAGSPSNAAGLAAILELGRMLKEDSHAVNNYLIVAFGGRGRGMEGASYFINHLPAGIKSLDYVLNLDLNSDASGTLIVSGTRSSPSWKPLLKATGGSRPDWEIPQEDTLIAESVVFSQSAIPSVTLTGNAGGPAGDAHEQDKTYLPQIRLIYKFIQTADSRGKLGYAAPDR
jgi:Iap family predicted aminopeptidase